MKSEKEILTKIKKKMEETLEKHNNNLDFINTTDFLLLCLLEKMEALK